MELPKVEAVTWFVWQDALDKAVRPGGQVDAESLISAVLQACVRGEDGQPLGERELGLLAGQTGDQLLAAVMDVVERQRQALAIQVDEQDGFTRIAGDGFCFHARRWTFGERNAALRQALRLVDGQVNLDLALYERLMVLRCVTCENGERLGPADLAQWPYPLGEAVLAALDRLNGVAPAYAETLQAAIRDGNDHPDLALIQLCRTFGWSPQAALDLDAGLAERLLIGIRALEQSLAAAPGPPAAAQSGAGQVVAVPPGYVTEGVKRIIVRQS